MARAVLAALVLHLFLIQPNHPDALSWRALLLFALELPVVLCALIALGQSRAGFWLRVSITAGLTLIAALKGADFAMFTALNRGFNPVADLPLVVSLFQLVVGAFGPIAAVLAGLVAVLAVLAAAAGIWWACAIWAQIARPPPIAALAGVTAVSMGLLAAMEVRAIMAKEPLPVALPGTALTARLGVERVVLIRDTLEDLRAFRAAAKSDPFARQDGLLDLLDRDLFVIFVESYGRTSFDTPYFADLHLETLRRAEADLRGRGLSMASTFLEAPTQGGQSWLSHASFANGLWVDNQTSYRAVLGSGRRTLFHLAREAGFHTAAVMPQITLDWPESASMGFDTILAAKDLGYRGTAFNWITMPDQFTYAAMDRMLRQAERPLFVQVATGSSHAPWVPVPKLLDWDEVGDGSVFNALVEGSDPPSVVWQDDARVREQYRAAVDYALQAVFAYADLHSEEAPLMLIIGDHQAAGFVALDERPHVPMHILGPRHLVDLLALEGFTPGLVPSEENSLRRMSELRAHILRALSSTHLAGASE